ncbi:GGDEF domain-containing protein [Vreelandella rituensis]|uniref:diguanylate cyclase n=1 Tax=Vreelandella rituensis TaxID=2282306 RepID=A0A368U142_9GAMM|nr:GGDEF domain-containing protein [Halomonas rituensis]RCV90748.1 GGDEF domain-containing protein [Halomonas rituensis]
MNMTLEDNDHSDRFFSRWRLVTGFAVMAGIAAIVIGVYVNHARQQVGADYTAMVGDVVRAQQQNNQLNQVINVFMANPASVHLPEINHFLWLAQRHLEGIQNSIGRYPLLEPHVSYLSDDFKLLESQLTELERLALQTIHDNSFLEPLQQLGMEMEVNMAWIYSELNNAVHAAAGEQYRVTQQMSRAVIPLVLFVLIMTASLFAAVINLQQQRNKMHKLMLTDELTGLKNRRYLVSIATTQLANAQRQQHPLSLMILDLDYFKHVNDTYGHPAGDEVLRLVTGCIASLCRQSDTLARIGGEEFCLLMPNTSMEEAKCVAMRIRQKVASLELDCVKDGLRITVSIGLTTTITGEQTFEQLYSLADQALYQAKETGRNRVDIVLPPVHMGGSDSSYTNNAEKPKSYFSSPSLNNVKES